VSARELEVAQQCGPVLGFVDVWGECLNVRLAKPQAKRPDCSAKVDKLNMGFPCQIARLDGKHTLLKTCDEAGALTMTAIGIGMSSDERSNAMQMEQVDRSV
jgi:hypothetical protein